MFESKLNISSVPTECAHAQSMHCQVQLIQRRKTNAVRGRKFVVHSDWMSGNGWKNVTERTRKSWGKWWMSEQQKGWVNEWEIQQVTEKLFSFLEQAYLEKSSPGHSMRTSLLKISHTPLPLVIFQSLPRPSLEPTTMFFEVKCTHCQVIGPPHPLFLFIWHQLNVFIH